MYTYMDINTYVYIQANIYSSNVGNRNIVHSVVFKYIHFNWLTNCLLSSIYVYMHRCLILPVTVRGTSSGYNG